MLYCGQKMVDDTVQRTSIYCPRLTRNTRTNPLQRRDGNTFPLIFDERIFNIPCSLFAPYKPWLNDNLNLYTPRRRVCCVLLKHTEEYVDGVNEYVPYVTKNFKLSNQRFNIWKPFRWMEKAEGSMSMMQAKRFLKKPKSMLGLVCVTCNV